MKRVILLVGLFAVAFGTHTFAASDGPGCGWGSMIFKGQSGLVPNTLAATTNGISGNQTFGLTSGTAGCKADSVVMNDKEQEAFVTANLGSLNQEMAQGQGEHVAALATLMGCPTAVHSAFASMSQESYGVMFSKSDVQASAVLAALKTEMGRRPVLASSCGRIS